MIAKTFCNYSVLMQRPYWFTESKDDVCESDLRRIGHIYVNYHEVLAWLVWYSILATICSCGNTSMAGRVLTWKRSRRGCKMNLINTTKRNCTYWSADRLHTLLPWNKEETKTRKILDYRLNFILIVFILNIV